MYNLLELKRLKVPDMTNKAKVLFFGNILYYRNFASSNVNSCWCHSVSCSTYSWKANIVCRCIGLQTNPDRETVAHFLKFRTPLFLFLLHKSLDYFLRCRKWGILYRRKLFSFSVSARRTFILSSTKSYSAFQTERYLKDFIICGEIFINQRFNSYQKKTSTISLL